MFSINLTVLISDIHTELTLHAPTTTSVIGQGLPGKHLEVVKARLFKNDMNI